MAGGLLGFVAQAGEASAATLPGLHHQLHRHMRGDADNDVGLVRGARDTRGRSPAGVDHRSPRSDDRGRLHSDAQSALVPHPPSRPTQAAQTQSSSRRSRPGRNRHRRLSRRCVVQSRRCRFWSQSMCRLRAVPHHARQRGPRSSAPYASGAVTICPVGFSIPDFSSGGRQGARLAVSGVNTALFWASVNEMSLSLTGALPLPPPPASRRTISLRREPGGPVLVGANGDPHGGWSATVGSTPAPTGHVTFMSGSTIVGSASLAQTTVRTKRPLQRQFSPPSPHNR